jgi:hypothetical protein
MSISSNRQSRDLVETVPGIPPILSECNPGGAFLIREQLRFTVNPPSPGAAISVGVQGLNHWYLAAFGSRLPIISGSTLIVSPNSRLIKVGDTCYRLLGSITSLWLEGPTEVVGSVSPSLDSSS